MRILVIILMSFSLVHAQSYKVMTYNIRYDTPNDGVNQWGSRKEKVFTLLMKHDPDILGVQEALHHQLEQISASLPQYEWIGVGRDDGKEKGEYSAVFYKKDKLEVVEQKTYWLSETPDVAGSKSWDAAITRVVTWVRFKDKEKGNTFQVFNTHFDHIGKEARKNSALFLQRLILDFGKKYGDGIIVTGDFNAEQSEEPYTIMTQPASQVQDTRSTTETAGTFCGFEMYAIPCRTIDYIFVSAHWKVSNYLVIQDNDGKYYPSDHLPVVVTLTGK